MPEPGYVITYDGPVADDHAIVLAEDDEMIIVYVPSHDKCAEIATPIFDTRDEFFARRMVKSEIAKLTTEKGAEIADQARQVYVNGR